MHPFHPRPSSCAIRPCSKGEDRSRLAPTVKTDEPLPTALAIFPLPGVVLLPGNSLPLHIFEPRYRNMVEDALAGDGVIGMIQPRDRVAEEPTPGEVIEVEPVEPLEPVAPKLYSVGCAGRIRLSQRLPDGRYLILLIGLSRFRVLAELPGVRGYRRVEAGYAEFGGDSSEAQELLPDLDSLLSDVRDFGLSRGLELDFEQLKSIPPPQLVNVLSAFLPFAPAEKQALLEARGLVERSGVLTALLAMSGPPVEPGDDEPPAN